MSCIPAIIKYSFDLKKKKDYLARIKRGFASGRYLYISMFLSLDWTTCKAIHTVVFLLLFSN